MSTTVIKGGLGFSNNEMAMSPEHKSLGLQTDRLGLSVQLRVRTIRYPKAFVITIVWCEIGQHIPNHRLHLFFPIEAFSFLFPLLAI